MKFQNQFSGKSKNISIYLQLKILPSMLSIKINTALTLSAALVLSQKCKLLINHYYALIVVG